MNRNKKKIVIALIGVILATASIIIPFIYFFLSNDAKIPQIVFIPKYLKSFPNHTAWLLAEVHSVETDFTDNCSIIIEPNESIYIDYKVWDNQDDSKVLELFVKPNSTHLNHIIEIKLELIDNKINLEGFATIEVINWGSKNITEVQVMRDAFISYLSSNRSSFGINKSLIWEGFDNAPQILIVEHYLFRSEYWELALSRHVMIAPHDWVRVYIRPRNQITPIWSGIIESWSSGNHNITELEPELSIYR
ncbi:MAG: hypothetical protein HWN80_02225 [Candidatus Lokiarchaeota archaeon]|nr:hypothetical protein [Candidatus Lokiarchaeota archaeon]